MRRALEGLVDFHAHCLPGADHGAPSLSVAVAQRRLMKEAGLSAVVATPHFYSHKEVSVDAFLTRRDGAAAALLSAAPEGPALYLGAEVLVTPGLDEMEGLSRLCIKGTDILLLEMPLGGWSRECVRTLERIAKMGVTPLLAHIDRYPITDLEYLFESSRLLYQINAVAILGLSYRARYFRHMVRAEAVAAFGSDLHGAHPAAYRAFLRAVRRARAGALTVAAHSAELLSRAIPATPSEE
ncbi:MAG: hypothetical protein IJF73_02205 [Clostridia bacterium]|nr:hypothetical protein [Clostridia bacterium]